MKRHPALVPLSHHHQNALALAKKLRTCSSESTTEKREELSAAVLDFWNGHGRDHFREEEEVVLAIWAKYEDPWSPQVERMLRDHIEIRSMVDAISQGMAQGDVVDGDRLKGLGERLDAHVRLEEHEVFEMAQRAIPEEELSRVKDLILGFQD